MPRPNQEPDMTTHSGMASELLRLLTQGGLQIPTGAARRFVEIEDWLSAIADGGLVVTENRVNEPPN